MYVLPFFKGKSERADILDLEVSNDGLSFEIVKSKIKNLAAAGLVGILVDPLLKTLSFQSTTSQRVFLDRLRNLFGFPKIRKPFWSIFQTTEIL